MAEGRYTGQLRPIDDTEDWYSFQVGTLGITGRLWVNIIVTDIPTPNAMVVQLRGPNANPTTGDRIITAEGTEGVRSIHYSIPVSGEWNIRLALDSQDGVSGEYEIALTTVIESEPHGSTPGEARDAGSGETGSPRNQLTSPNGKQFSGVLANGDNKDDYTFSAPAGTDFLVFVQFPRGSNGAAVLTCADGLCGNLQTRTGDGVFAFWKDGADSADSPWTLSLRRATDATTPELPYAVTVKFSPSTAESPEASNFPGGATTAIAEGIHLGQADNEDEDVYKLPPIQKGQLIRVGAASHMGGQTTAFRPALLLQLMKSNEVVLAESRPCQNAGGLIFTAENAENYYVKVSEALTGCAGTVSNAGPYSFSVEITDQPDEAGEGDAPSDFSAAIPLPPDPEDGATPQEGDGWILTGWSDESDFFDTFLLGQLGAGTVVRVGLGSETAAQDFKIQLLKGPHPGTLAASSTGANGRARLNAAVGSAGTYAVRIEQVSPYSTGLYHFYIETGGNQAPVPVVLAAPGVSQIGRNHVDLDWTESGDDDFKHYEVHASTQSGFTPGTSTRKEIITDQTDSATRVTGLNSNTQYQFLILVVDDSNFVSESNRRTVTTSAVSPGNVPPTLSNGRVTPNQGGTTTSFSFEVTYTDGDNDAPHKKVVEIDGTEFTMASTDTTYSNGAVFTLSKTLGQGSHEFRFEFSDGGTEVNNPTAGFHQGPTVSGSGNTPPSASASADPETCDVPCEVDFDVSASDPDGDSLSYSWDFDTSNGIQSESSAKSPTHTYTSPGEKTARVAVSDGRGATSPSLVTISVGGTANQEPTVEATATPTSGAAPLTVQFGATADDEDGTISSYKWDFDDKDGLQSQSTAQNPSHTYTTGGSFVATVTVRDNGGEEATDTVTVVVSSGDNDPPSIAIEANRTRGLSPLTVDFTADVLDPDGDDVTIEWDFDQSDGVTVEAEGNATDHVFSGAGTYIVLATATDEHGSKATDTVTITVLGGNETSAVVIRATPREGKAPLTVNFDADTSMMPASPKSYRWDFGDNSSAGTVKKLAHTYDKTGSYNVVLTVTDENDVEYESTVLIRVKSKGTPGFEVGLFALAAVAVAFAMRKRDQGPK